jgi:hypothetical protein
MEATPGVVKHLLRNLYHPVALRRDALANAIRLFHRQNPASRPFDETDIRLVQRFALWCVTALDAEQHTLRGALQRRRQRVIIEHYDIGGQPRDHVASGLGISLRQFYRERQIALQRLADSIADALRLGERNGAVHSDEQRVPVERPVRADETYFRQHELERVSIERPALRALPD